MKQRAARAGGKIIGRGRVADVEIKMRVRVDKAGEQELCRHIHDLCALAEKVFSDGGDLLAVDQKVCLARNAAANDRAALERAREGGADILGIMLAV